MYYKQAKILIKSVYRVRYLKAFDYVDIKNTKRTIPKVLTKGLVIFVLIKLKRSFSKVHF